MKKVLLFSYGASSQERLTRALKASGVNVITTSSARAIHKADALIIPHEYDDNTTLSKVHSVEILLESMSECVALKKPMLCIGLAMSLLASGHTHPTLPAGLGLLSVPVQRFDPHLTDDDGHPLLTPHTGFSSLLGLRRHPCFTSLQTTDNEEMTETFTLQQDVLWMYYRHRLLLPARLPGVNVAVSHHGVPFAGAAWDQHWTALQFLPEFSGPIGLKLLSLWCENV